IIYVVKETGNPKMYAPMMIGKLVREIHAREQEAIIEEHYLDVVSLFLDEISRRIIGESYEAEVLTDSSPFLLHKEAFAENLELVRQGVWNIDEARIYEGLMKIISLSVTGQISDINPEDPRRKKLLTDFAGALSDLSRKLISENRKIASLGNFVAGWSTTLEDYPDPELVFIVYSLHYMTRNLTTDVIHIDIEILRETMTELGHLLSRLSSELLQGDRKPIFLTLVEIHSTLKPFVM
ncbi:hypothetical protein MUP77_09180, partial [Candidatus Bathyarchaeota archaeon]|nr:hypothetical protein [Candidatus Bathyarchaeota archaeon]